MSEQRANARQSVVTDIVAEQQHTMESATNTIGDEEPNDTRTTNGHGRRAMLCYDYTINRNETMIAGCLRVCVRELARVGVYVYVYVCMCVCIYSICLYV